jgi:ABC-type nitrate/sulfonate/bicarbonate transport system ATPase subunit
MSKKILLSNVSKTFTNKNGQIKALHRVSFEINESELLCVVGPSGCGKTTIISLIAGFIFPDEGEVVVDGITVQGPNFERPVVFQEDALFPWKTVKENIEFGLKCRNHDTKFYESQAKEFIRKMRLIGFENRFPSELSVGMKQRVGIARALILQPKVVLMDEPFGSLDQQTRYIIQEELLQLHSDFKPTVVFVSHDIEESIFLGDRIVLLSKRPGTVKLVFKVPFSRPRSPEIRNSSDFIELRHSIWHNLREEVE